MKQLTNGNQVAERHCRQQILCHSGLAGRRRHAREIVTFGVSQHPRSSPTSDLWHGRFVAGDHLQIVAHHPDGGALEVTLLDAGREPVELKKTPGPTCRISTKVRQSGIYHLRVRDLSGKHALMPFEVTCERWVPRRRRLQLPQSGFGALVGRGLEHFSLLGWHLRRRPLKPDLA